MTLAGPNQSAGELERLVSAFIEYARHMSLDLSRQWLVLADDRPVSACTCLETSGRTAMLFVPAHPTAAAADAVTALLRHALAEETRRDVRLVQCLLPPDDQAGRDNLASVGFRDLAILRYLECRLTDHPQPPEPVGPPDVPSSSLEWITYGAEQHQEFADLILATYEGSQDCRGLAGLREIDDIIAGHKAAGRFDPDRWALLRCGGQPAACILLVENPVRVALEVVYTGVHPAYRRQGLGRYVLQYGLSLSQREGCGVVTLAVDSDNTAAGRLYDEQGFRQTLARRAMIFVSR